MGPFLAVLLVVGACGSVEPGGRDAGGPDSGPGGGGDDGGPDASGAETCEPDTAVCADDRTVVCDASGTVTSMAACPVGCHPDGDRCNDIDPSNGLGAHLDDAAAAPDLVLTDGAVIDADDGQITDGDGSPLAVPTALVDGASGGVPVRVLIVASLRTGDLVIAGSPALAVVSAGDVLVEGTITVQSGRILDENPTCAGARGDTCLAGGGGGGFGGRGGDGGSFRSAAGELVAGGEGASSSGAVDLQPLRGGCEGGAFGGTGGGEGGGAVQIVSRTAIVLRGAIAASGASGRSFAGGLCGRSGIGGAGSGGAILLEAPRVEVAGSAALVANGGSGGCKDSRGQDGPISEDGAPITDCDSPDGDGGRGGARNGGAGNGISGAAGGGAGGGGGGGAGRIRVNTAFDRFVVEPGAIVSPAPSVGAIATR